jgi:hypothetical protein
MHVPPDHTCDTVSDGTIILLAAQFMCFLDTGEHHA